MSSQERNIDETNQVDQDEATRVNEVVETFVASAKENRSHPVREMGHQIVLTEPALSQQTVPDRDGVIKYRIEVNGEPVPEDVTSEVIGISEEEVPEEVVWEFTGERYRFVVEIGSDNEFPDCRGVQVWRRYSAKTFEWFVWAYDAFTSETELRFLPDESVESCSLCGEPSGVVGSVYEGVFAEYRQSEEMFCVRCGVEEFGGASEVYVPDEFERNDPDAELRYGEKGL